MCCNLLPNLIVCGICCEIAFKIIYFSQLLRQKSRRRKKILNLSVLKQSATCTSFLFENNIETREEKKRNLRNSLSAFLIITYSWTFNVLSTERHKNTKRRRNGWNGKTEPRLTDLFEIRMAVVASHARYQPPAVWTTQREENDSDSESATERVTNRARKRDRENKTKTILLLFSFDVSCARFRIIIFSFKLRGKRKIENKTILF